MKSDKQFAYVFTTVTILLAFVFVLLQSQSEDYSYISLALVTVPCFVLALVFWQRSGSSTSTKQSLTDVLHFALLLPVWVAISAGYLVYGQGALSVTDGSTLVNTVFAAASAIGFGGLVAILLEKRQIARWCGVIFAAPFLIATAVLIVQTVTG